MAKKQRAKLDKCETSSSSTCKSGDKKPRVWHQLWTRKRRRLNNIEKSLKKIRYMLLQLRRLGSPNRELQKRVQEEFYKAKLLKDFLEKWQSETKQIAKRRYNRTKAKAKAEIAECQTEVWFETIILWCRSSKYLVRDGMFQKNRELNIKANLKYRKRSVCLSFFFLVKSQKSEWNCG